MRALQHLPFKQCYNQINYIAIFLFPQMVTASSLSHEPSWLLGLTISARSFQCFLTNTNLSMCTVHSLYQCDCYGAQVLRHLLASHPCPLGPCRIRMWDMEGKSVRGSLGFIDPKVYWVALKLPTNVYLANIESEGFT